MRDFATRQQVKEVYRRRAPHYDLAARLFDILGFGYERLRREAVEALALNPGDTVVDIGCGTGINFQMLEERIGTDGRIIGVDLTREMLDEAQRRIDASGWGNIELVHCSAAEYRFPAHGVDGVLSTFALTLEPDHEAVIESIARTLRPERRFAIADLKLANGWRLVFLPFLLPLVRPFAVSLKLAKRHPWEAMSREMADFRMTEHLCGYLYVASAASRASILNTEPFDGAKSVHPVRRKARRDAGHRASFATTPVG